MGHSSTALVIGYLRPCRSQFQHAVDRPLLRCKVTYIVPLPIRKARESLMISVAPPEKEWSSGHRADTTTLGRPSHDRGAVEAPILRSEERIETSTIPRPSARVQLRRVIFTEHRYHPGTDFRRLSGVRAGNRPDHGCRSDRSEQLAAIPVPSSKEELMSDQSFSQNNPVPSEYGTSMPRYVPSSPGTPPHSSTGGEDSTADVAKSQARDVAGDAKGAAQQVAATAKEQAGEVAHEAKTQVKQVVGQAQSELSDQAQAQQTKAADGLHSLGDQLAAMARGSDQPGMATDVAQQAADRAHEFAGWLENRDPQGVLNEVRSFARRKPGVFLVAALGAGILSGRLARGMSADGDAATSSGSPRNAQADRSSTPSQGVTGSAHAQLPPSSSRSQELADGSNESGFRDAPAHRRDSMPGAQG